MMKRDLNFVLSYNQRDDNLGDQVIFTNLARALTEYGNIFSKNKCPDFFDRKISDIKGSREMADGALVEKFIEVGSPGAMLWTPSKPKMIGAAHSISLGNSVIKGGDHKWCNSYDWIGMRDESSVQELRYSGYPQVSYFPDLSLLSELFFPNMESHQEEKIIGFSFRPTVPEERRPDVIVKLVSEVVGRMKNRLLGSRSKYIRLFHQVEGDAPFMSLIGSLMKLEVVDQKLNINDFSDFYRSTHLVVSNRLHCLLFAAINGSLPIALVTSNHEKIISLFNTLGWRDLIAYCDRPNEAVKKIEKICEDEACLRSLVRSSLLQHRRIAENCLKDLFDQFIE